MPSASDFRTKPREYPPQREANREAALAVLKPRQELNHPLGRFDDVHDREQDSGASAA